ncbi:MAG TPA: hypothetical protein DIT09_12185 [Glutamicibacter sp.]|uniref:Uncharacterized protein n=2 Tax=Micrococcales TaxID=85006 RepID=A0A2N7S0Z1_9MICC|nr:hypothetical protein CIK84_14305 [Glutamicibacter arilaitensis]HCJ54023.1 hypothetical protein [Glutamicibacter sp.]HCM95365.1 hypothetical protein [Glutamicibacter sp.]
MCAVSGGGVMSELSDEELVERTTALVGGLEQIAKRYEEHVFLAWEDPVTFGAGHFVLYPEAGEITRFAIEEQYTDTDWSDDERIATSWTWDSQARVRQPDGDCPWVSLAHGEVAPGDYAQLLGLAEDWAKTTHTLAEREQALTVDPLTAPGVERHGGQRTFLS